MANINLFNVFLADMANKVHDLSSDTLKMALSNVAPVATYATLSQVIQITAGNGYTAGGTALANVTSTQTSGVYKLEADDVVFTASGGAILEFRYCVLYNSTTATDRLIGYWDNGAAVNVQNTYNYTILFTDGDILTIQ